MTFHISRHNLTSAGAVQSPPASQVDHHHLAVPEDGDADLRLLALRHFPVVERKLRIRLIRHDGIYCRGIGDRKGWRLGARCQTARGLFLDGIRGASLCFHIYDSVRCTREAISRLLMLYGVNKTLFILRGPSITGFELQIYSFQYAVPSHGYSNETSGQRQQTVFIWYT